MTNDPNSEEWVTRKKIQVILAHPDDPEFFCGATIAHWCSIGHEVSYTLLTKGQRGTRDENASLASVADIRVREQILAAARLGVRNIKFLNFLDGDLVPDLNLRREIIKEIRIAKPDIVVTSDPMNLFPGENRINHPDHRAAGQAVLDAVFPAVGNPGHRINGDQSDLKAHKIEEVWLTLTRQPNFEMFLPGFFDRKIEAISCHQSQLTYTESQLREKYKTSFAVNPLTGKHEYKESFLRIKLNP